MTMTTAKRSKKWRNEPSVLDYFSKSKRKKTSKSQVTQTLGTPATHYLGEAHVYQTQSETPISVLSDDVLLESSVTSNPFHGSKRVVINNACDSEERMPDGGPSATPDVEPNTPSSHPTSDRRSVLAGALPSETPPSHDTYMTTPPSPPSPADSRTWKDCLIVNRKGNDSNAKREIPRDDSCYRKGDDVETPESLLKTVQQKVLNTNLEKLSKIGTHPTHRLGRFSRTCRILTSNPSNKSSKSRQLNGSMSFSNQQDAKLPKHQKQSTKQLFLDFGQNSFGKQSICSICGMLRVHGMAEDDAEHAKICQKYNEGVTCFGWKNERSVATFEMDERILEVRPEDAPQHRMKIAEVKMIVDSELGFARRSNEKSMNDAVNMTSYIYVSKKRVVGLLSVRRIQRAYELLPSSISRSCSLNSSKALLGIHQIWVHNSHRSRGIASKLVTAARDHFIFGMMIPLELVAFSSPTEEGLRFAKRYLDSERPLVYDINK